MRGFPSFLPFNTLLEYMPSFALIWLGFLEYAMTLRIKKFQIFFLLGSSFFKKLTFGGYIHCFKMFHDWVAIKNFCQREGT